MIAVRPPASLIHVALADMSRDPRRWPPSLHVNDHARDFRHDRVAQRFLHQRKAGTACGCHDFTSRKGSPDNGAHRGDFIFHLYELAASYRKPKSKKFGNLRGWSDGITR